MNILLIFFALTACNVIFSTVKSITTVRGSPGMKFKNARNQLFLDKLKFL